MKPLKVVCATLLKLGGNIYMRISAICAGVFANPQPTNQAMCLLRQSLQFILFVPTNSGATDRERGELQRKLPVARIWLCSSDFFSKRNPENFLKESTHNTSVAEFD